MSGAILKHPARRYHGMVKIRGFEKLIAELTEYDGPATPDIIEKEAQVSSLMNEIEENLRPIRSLVHSYVWSGIPKNFSRTAKDRRSKVLR
jgi:hypothetical protein